MRSINREISDRVYMRIYIARESYNSERKKKKNANENENLNKILMTDGGRPSRLMKDKWDIKLPIHQGSRAKEASFLLIETRSVRISFGSSGESNAGK